MDAISKKTKGLHLDNVQCPGGYIEGLKNANAGLAFLSVQKKPALYRKGKKTYQFFTEDSKRYITPRELEVMRRGGVPDRKIKKWDSASSRIVENYKQRCYSDSSLLRALEKRKAFLDDAAHHISRNIIDNFTIVRLWNTSIVGAILFGMVTMTFIYKYLGQGASADVALRDYSQASIEETIKSSPQVLGTEASRESETLIEDLLEKNYQQDKENFERELREMVKGYPIEKMIPYIAEKDRTVAAFLVGIARKESAWGEHVPVLNGQDCYNYWGYRQQRKLMGSGGHTCFNSPKDAVDTVSKRIETLVKEKKLDTPEKMIIWKCGSECSVKNRPDERKWISDVSIYFEKLNDSDK